MHTAYLVVTLLLAAYLAFSAAADFARWHKVLTAMAKAGVPESWLPTLGLLKGAAGVGLLLGIGVPGIGIAAAGGTILFFIGAIATHLHARFYSFGAPASFLVLAVAALALTVAVV